MRITIALIITLLSFTVLLYSLTVRADDDVMLVGLGIQWACYEKPLFHEDAFDNAMRELDEAEKLGVDLVRIDIEADTYFKFQLQYDSLFTDIRARNLKLFLWALPTSGTAVGLTDYNDWVVSLAEKYKPEYLDTYGETPNPHGTLSWRIAETPSMSVEDWVKESFTIAERIREVSKNTKIGFHSNAGKSPGNKGFDVETAFFSKVANINGPFDWVGIEPYSVEEVNQQERVIQHYWDGTIPLWIAETDYLVVHQEDNDTIRRQILEKTWSLANRYRFEGYILFALYDNPYFWEETDRQHWGILDRNWEKKPSYYLFQNLVESRQIDTTTIVTTIQTVTSTITSAEGTVTITETTTSTATSFVETQSQGDSSFAGFLLFVVIVGVSGYFVGKRRGRGQAGRG